MRRPIFRRLRQASSPALAAKAWRRRAAMRQRMLLCIWTTSFDTVCATWGEWADGGVAHTFSECCCVFEKMVWSLNAQNFTRTSVLIGHNAQTNYKSFLTSLISHLLSTKSKTNSHWCQKSDNNIEVSRRRTCTSTPLVLRKRWGLNRFQR